MTDPDPGPRGRSRGTPKQARAPKMPDALRIPGMFDSIAVVLALALGENGQGGLVEKHLGESGLATDPLWSAALRGTRRFVVQSAAAAPKIDDTADDDEGGD